MAGHLGLRIARSVPLLLSLPRHRWRCRVLDLQPAIGATGSVRRAKPLRHDALASERAGVLVDDRAIAAVMLIEGNAFTLPAQQPCQCGPAFLDWQSPHIVTVESNEIEGAQHHSLIAASIP